MCVRARAFVSDRGWSHNRYKDAKKLSEKFSDDKPLAKAYKEAKKAYKAASAAALIEMDEIIKQEANVGRLVCSLWDYDTIGSDDLLAAFSFELAELVLDAESPTEHWLEGRGTGALAKLLS